MAFSYRAEKIFGRPASLLKVIEDEEAIEKSNISESYESRSVMDDPKPVDYRKSRPMNRNESNSFSCVENADSKKDRNLSVVSSDEYRLHKKNEDWNSLQSTVIGLFQKKKLPKNELAPLLEKVRNLINSKAGTFVYDYYQKQLLTRGMIILREEVRLKKGQELLSEIANLWDYFFSYILPEIEVILLPLSIKFMVQTKGLTVRQSTLLGFRDIIVLKVDLKNAIIESDDVPSSITQMLLVLKDADASTNPTKPQLQIEAMLCRLINPYLGFHGLYEGGDEPVVYGTHTVCSRVSKPSNIRKLMRPLSVQIPQAVTLNQMFQNAARKARHNN